MVKLAFLALVLLTSAAGAGPIATAELLWKGNATSYYGESGNSRQAEILQLMRDSKMAERMAMVAQGFRLRSDIAVGFESCGKANAYFNPSRQTIVMCSEYFELVLDAINADAELRSKFSGPQLNGWLKGIIWSTYFHELAHALIHVNRVGITDVKKTLPTNLRSGTRSITPDLKVSQS